MKTEMKMIAAILAVLAVALGGVYALDTAQAAEDSTQAIWPADGPEGSTLPYQDWIVDGEARKAKWETETVDENKDVTYWLDITNGGAWITILGGTEFEFQGNHESFRVKAEGVDNNGKIRVTNLQVQPYNFRAGYQIDNVGARPLSNMDQPNLADCATIETDIGTIYLDAVYIEITGNKQAASGTASVYATMAIPVLVIEQIDVTGDYTFAYKYNNLVQTPIKELGGDNADASTPYVHFNDCFDKYSEYGVEWVYDGVTFAKNTNKLAALAEVGAKGYDFENGYYYDADGNPVYPVVKEYTATMVPSPANQFVTGKITIHWWILPLGLEDINFTVADPYYNFDEEVFPKIVMTWTEPEDGPNGAATRYVNNPDYSETTYGVLDDDAYYVSSTSYVQKMTDGEPVKVQLRDQYGRLMYKVTTTEKEFVQDCDIVYVEVDENNEIVGDYYIFVDGKAVEAYIYVKEPAVYPTAGGAKTAPLEKYYKPVYETTYTEVKTVENPVVVYVEVDENNEIVGDKYYTISTTEGVSTATEITTGFPVPTAPVVMESDTAVTADSKTYMPVYETTYTAVKTTTDSKDVYVEVDVYGDIVGDKYYTISTTEGVSTATEITTGFTAPTVPAVMDVEETAANCDCKLLPVYSGFKMVSIPKTALIGQDKDVFGRLVYEDLFEASTTQITIEGEAETGSYLPAYDTKAITVGEGDEAQAVYVKVTRTSDDADYTIADSSHFYTISTTEGVSTATEATGVTATELSIKQGEAVVIEGVSYLPAYDTKKVTVGEGDEAQDVYAKVTRASEDADYTIDGNTLYTISMGEEANVATAIDLAVTEPSVKQTDTVVTASTSSESLNVYVEVDSAGKIKEQLAFVTIDGTSATDVTSRVNVTNPVVKDGVEPTPITVGDDTKYYLLAYELGDAAITVGEDADAKTVYVEVEKEEGSDVYTPIEADGKYAGYTIAAGESGNVAKKVAEYTLVAINSEDEVTVIGEKSYMPAYAPAEVDVFVLDANGEKVQRHVLYYNNQFAYYQKVDENGMPVYDENGMPVPDLDNPIMVDFTVTVPNYDEGSPVVYAYEVPVTTEVPKYDENSQKVEVEIPTKVPVTDQGKPVYEQEVNDLGLPVYKKYLYKQLTFETGQLNGGNDLDNYVWMQAVNADGTLKFDSKTGLPVWNYAKPVYDYTKKAPVYVQTNASGVPLAVEGKYTYVYVLESLGQVTVLGVTGVEPQVDTSSKVTVVGDTATTYYAKVIGYVDKSGEEPVNVAGEFYAYDSNSSPVYVEETEWKIDFSQVGFPYEREVFNYTVHIVYNSGYVEFDSADYVGSQAIYGAGEITVDDQVHEAGDIVFAPLYDEKGKLMFDSNGNVRYDEDSPLFTWNYILVEQDGKQYVVPSGVPYEAD